MTLPLSSRVVRLVRNMAGDWAARLLLRKRLEGAFDPDWYLTRYPDVHGRDPLVHYAAFGAAEGRDPHPLFDSAFYLRRYPETAGQIPADNYLRDGLAQRRHTHPDRGFCLIPPVGRPLRIVSLLVRYGTERYPNADDRLEAVLAEALPTAERRTVIIDNALPLGTGPRQLGPRCVVIPGDNSSWEFSGWEEGLRFLGDELSGFDFIHFATDAFEQLGPDFAGHLNTRALEALRYGPCIAGHIDYYNDQPVLAEWAVPCWVRSSWFFIRPAEVSSLKSMATFRNGRHLFSGDPERPFLAGGPVDERLSAYIIGWLTGDGTGQGVQWHSRFTLSADTLRRFEEKARAILNELALSARLRQMGCWTADALWLDAVLKGAVPGRLFEESWDSQIRNRSHP